MKRWSQQNGYRDVLSLGLPLVVSLGSTTVMQFTDRVFLGNYSLDAIAAALPAGIASFLFACFFMGVGSYVNVFVAQYIGARRPERVGAALWQGLYFCAGTGVILFLAALLAEPLFSLVGHPAEVRELEAVYFRILAMGSVLLVGETTLSSFYSGRGLTRVVMFVNIFGAAVNIPLDYALIYGVGVFPEWGIAGAGVATVFAWGVIFSSYVLLIFRKKNEDQFRVRSAWRFDRDLFRRLMKYGLPGGVQFFLDIFAITFFVFMVGRLGKPELAATNIVFSIDTLSFLPMIGLSIAISTLVGQALGADRPDLAMQATISTLHITLVYMTIIASVFVLFPHPLLELFRSEETSPAEFAPIAASGVVLLRFVAFYSLVDAVALTYFGALKGAGDSRFLMTVMAFVSLLLMCLPLYVAVEYFHVGLITCWIILTVYILLFTSVMVLRYRNGKWKDMRVIEGG